MTSTKVFNLRYLTKHILLFCGIEERILLSYVNKTANGEYGSIIPNLGDVKQLLGNSITEIKQLDAQEILNADLRIKSSYLMFDLRIHNGMSGLGQREMCGKIGICIFDQDVLTIMGRIVMLIDNGIRIINLALFDHPKHVISIRCSITSVLNNLPIMTKNKSPIIYYHDPFVTPNDESGHESGREN